MNQANLVTAGVAGALALILLYAILRVRLVATSGDGETRTVTEIEYRMAQMNAWMEVSMSAVGRILVPAFVVLAPWVALGPSLVAEAPSASFSFRAFFLALVLVIAPTLLVARRAFDEGRHSSPTSDIAYATQRAAASNRAILLRAFLAALLYAGLVVLGLLLRDVAWWVYGLSVVAALFLSLILMIGLSD